MFTSIGLRSEDVSEMQERTKGHQEYVASSGPDADQSWLGKLKPSGVAAFRLLEVLGLARQRKHLACRQPSLSHRLRICLGCTPQVAGRQILVTGVFFLFVAGDRVQEVP
jgi:hypothetical protein